MHECMKDEEKERLEGLTNKSKLGLGQKKEGRGFLLKVKC